MDQRSATMNLSSISLVMALAAGAAAAHATKQETTPADGAVLATTPDRIEMRFDAPMRLTMVRLSRADGETVPLEPSRALEPTTAFSAAPAALPPGGYMLEWRGLAADGHPMDGGFGFTVR
jgi:copper resistance protein C